MKQMPQVPQVEPTVEPTQPEPNQPTGLSTSLLNPGKIKQKLPWLVAAIILLGGLAAAGLLARQNVALKKQLAQAKQNPQQIAQDQVKDLIAQVGKLVVLPSDEQPTVATVTDLGPLKDQPFFANAKLDDKVLIYAKAKKAILYRPSENKIIEIAPVNLGDNGAPQPQVAGDSTTKPKK